jgi:hypothetical protein
MTPDTFIQKYSPYAFEVERETEIPAVAILAQGAHESDWSKKAIGKNLFGVKYKEGDWGYREVLTKEHSRNPNAFKNKKIHSRVYDAKTGIYTFKIWDKFADYPTPKECFLAHARLLLTKRYKHALRWKYSPKRYLIAVWRAGYATDEYYGNKMLGGYCKRNMKTYYSIVDSVTRKLKRLKITGYEKNIEISKREDMESSERQQTGYRDSALVGWERIGSIPPKPAKPAADRLHSNSRINNDGSGGGALNSKKGYNKETVKSYNKTEREVNSLIRFRLRLNIKLHDIKQFFLTLKKHKS